VQIRGEEGIARVTDNNERPRQSHVWPSPWIKEVLSIQRATRT